MSYENKIYPETLDTRVALLEQSIGSIGQTLIRIENRIDKIEVKLDKIEATHKSDFRWILTIIAALGGIMAHGFHWF